VKRVIFGQPIPETLASRERLNRTRALATLSSDALSSVAYGTEAALAVLVVAGASALSANLGIGLVTAALMLIVGYSYRQTIHAYPSGGGSYIVARENLGVTPGLIAAAALLIDYVLTVSVSVASGIDAIASAFPALEPSKLVIELGAIALITLLNLRGLRESGTIFAFPTYFFLGSFGLMILAGIVQALTHGGLAHAAAPQAPLVATEPLSLALILTAFAAGCSAMTGVEAISNGVPAFAGSTPAIQARHAAQTLVVMVGLLVTFFLGTTYLAWRVGAVPYPAGNPTVTSQIAHFAFPGALSWLFYVVQAATLLILVFAANTSFADFPRLASILARDTFLPAFFAYRGERIAFNVGIGTLGVLSAVILAIFRGNVVALINLYALGVFAAFTLSQSGMVVHWLRRRNETGWRQAHCQRRRCARHRRRNGDHRCHEVRSRRLGGRPPDSRAGARLPEYQRLLPSAPTPAHPRCPAHHCRCRLRSHLLAPGDPCARPRCAADATRLRAHLASGAAAGAGLRCPHCARHSHCARSQRPRRGRGVPRVVGRLPANHSSRTPRSCAAGGANLALSHHRTATG
jgi:amino acid transporter